jgi:hypothetical protein
VIPALAKNAFVEVTLPKKLEVAKKLVDDAFVNTAVEAPLAPIGVLLIVPPSTVRVFTTYTSAIELVGSDTILLVTVRIPMVVDGEISEPVIVSPLTFTNRESYAEPSA